MVQKIYDIIPPKINKNIKVKKQIIQKQFIKKLKIKIDDEDIIDAMVLAMNGILEEKI